MITILEDILCVVTGLASIIEYAAVSVVNFLIVGLAGVLSAIALILPSMPSFPDFSGLDMSWLPYFIPVQSIVAMLGIGITLFAAMFGLRIALRWVRAL